MFSSLHRFAFNPQGGALIALVVASGCSSTPAPKSVANVPASTEAQSAAPTAAPAMNSPTATAVSIDDAILRACGISNDDAYFAFDSAKLKPGDLSPLKKVAECFSAGPLKGRSMHLVGHADPRGEDEYNMVLGGERASTVKGFIAEDGVAKSRIATTSRGDMDATGRDEAGWSQDRRVDVMLGN